MSIKNETYFEFDNDLSEGFTTVPNYILNDKRLSFKAVGVYVQILQYRNSGTHKVYLKSLANYRIDKKTAVSTGMKELEECGYISKINLRNEKGQMNGVKYIVRMKPIVQCIENTTNEPKPENLTSDNPDSDNTLLKIKYIKKENSIKKENDVVVVSEKEKQLLEMYKSFKLEKKVMPHTTKLLKDNIDKFDLEVFEQIFISACEDSVEKKYAYIKKTLANLEGKGIFTIGQYNDDQEQRKATKNKTKATGSYAPETKSTNERASFKAKRNSQNCINETFRDYESNELETLLKDSQQDKFSNNDDVQANESESNQELRAQAIKNVNANNFLTVIEGDPFWEKQIEDEIERLSNN